MCDLSGSKGEGDSLGLRDMAGTPDRVSVQPQQFVPLSVAAELTALTTAATAAVGEHRAAVPPHHFLSHTPFPLSYLPPPPKAIKKKRKPWSLVNILTDNDAHQSPDGN
jgi:hypothetical protein